MSKRVLVVDDDPNNVKYLTVLLDQNGYAATAAVDGAEGLRKIQSDKPDLVVLDVMMPERSGFGVFRTMKKNPETSGIPVIMLTSIRQVIEEGKNTSEDSVFEQMKDQMIGKMEKVVGHHSATGEIKPEMFIDKPIEPDDFLKAVVSLIGK